MPDTESRLNGAPAVSIGVYLAPGANAVDTSAAVSAALNELSARFPPDIKAKVFYDSSSFVPSTIHEVQMTLIIAFVLVVRGGLSVFGQCAGHDHPDGGDPSQPDRHFRGSAGLGLFRQHDLLAGVGARDRRRRRRCDRGGGERRTRHGGRAGPIAEGGDQEGDAADHRAGDRDLPGAAVGVRPDRVHSGPVRHAVPPVRGDDQYFDADLGGRRADAVAGAVRRVPAPQRTGRAARSAGCCGASTACATAMPGW